MSTQRASRDAGFATVWLVTAIAVIVVASTVAMGIGAVTIERHRAEAAADAAALAAAMHVLDGPTLACEAGAALAKDDGASLARCTLSAADATVEAQISLPGPLARFGVATGWARAGPASEATVLSQESDRAPDDRYRYSLDRTRPK